MKSKIVKCVDCGKEYPRKELNRHGRCRDCAWKLVGTVPYQLHYKEGPEYEKWRKRMIEVGIPRQIEGLQRWQAKLKQESSASTTG